MNQTFLTSINDLCEHQRTSYYDFLYNGIEQEFLSIPNPIRLKLNVPTRIKKSIVEYYFHPNEIFITGPESCYDDVLKNNLTYCIQIHLGSSYSYKIDLKDDFYLIIKTIFIILTSKESSFLEKKQALKFLKKFHFFFDIIKKYLNYDFFSFWKIFKKEFNPRLNYKTKPYFLEKKSKRLFNKLSKFWIKHNTCLGEIPLMTDEGTFLVTGCERVVINQIIKNSGVYFQKEFCPELGIKYSANIISDKGPWTKFTLTTENIEEFNQKEEDLDTNRQTNLENLEEESFFFEALDSIEKSFLFKENEIIEDFNKNNSYYSVNIDEEENQERFLLNSEINSSIISKNIISMEFYKSEDLEIEGFTVYLSDFLRFFDISLVELTEYLKQSKFLKEKGMDFYFPEEKEFSFNFLKNLRSNFYNLRDGYFSIGKNARYALNQKFGLRIPVNFTYLSIFDFLSIIDGLIELKYLGKSSDDIDHLKNKYVRCIGDFLQLQIRTAFEKYDFNSLVTFQRRKALETIENPNYSLETNSNKIEWILDARYITGLVKTFFKTSPLSQFLDHVNPLSEIGHKRKISSFGPDGLARDHVSTKIRDIHPSQYGRLCCIESPEGQTAGLISSLALYTKIGKYGSLESPYYYINNINFDPLQAIVYLTAEEESKIEIGFSDIILNKSIPNKISIKSNYSFLLKKKKDIKYLLISPLQIISLAASLVPFLEHNDANRSLMGANMQRQAVPLLKSEKPIVGTGLESVAVYDSKMILKSFSEGIVGSTTSTFIEIVDKNNQNIIYQLIKYTPSNQEVAFNQCPIVWPKEKVFRGQIIADGPGTMEGELALGKNLILAYMPWEGYNFEDSIVINENLVINDLFTSIHIQELDAIIELRDFDNEDNKDQKDDQDNENDEDQKDHQDDQDDENDNNQKDKELDKQKNLLNRNKNQEEKTKQAKARERTKRIKKIKEKLRNKETTKDIFSNRKKEELDFFDLLIEDRDYISKKGIFRTKYSQKNLNYQGIIKLGSYVKKNDILIAKFILPSILSSYEALQQVFHQILFGYSPNMKRDRSIRVPEGYEGRVLDFRVLDNASLDNPILESEILYSYKLYLRFSIGQLRKIELGDKLAGRHGNKGVVSKILSRQDMPYLPDGTPIDILLNPLGVPSRMNLGQLFESLLGFAGIKLGRQFKVSAFDEIYNKEASKILVNQKIKEACLKLNLSWFLFNKLKGKVYLRDGRTGEYFDNPVTVGNSYILKLIHLVEEKIHARSIGPYSMITEQPLAGKSQNGGQRFGEMEVWALEAYGCSYTLQELLTVKSDDIDSRNDLNQVLLGENQNKLPDPSISEGFLLLIRELNSLGLDFNFYTVNTSLKYGLEFKTNEINLFELLENRLKLRYFLSEKLVELSEVQKKVLNSQQSQKIKKKKKKSKVIKSSNTNL